MIRGWTSVLRSAVAGLVLAFGVAGQALPAPREGAETFIQSLSSEVMTVLDDRTLTPEQRLRQFEKLFLKGFDLEGVGRFVLGRHWRTMNDAQRIEYNRLLRDYVTYSYIVRLEEYSGESLVIRDSRTDPDGESLVHSVVDRPNRPPVKVDWRVRNDKGEFKITDIVVEGMSMAITHRAEFSAVIQSGGGKVESLLDALRKRATPR
jgi:phospholipid transport system substrate-binding protein